jgi:hypothetical protein
MLLRGYEATSQQEFVEILQKRPIFSMEPCNNENNALAYGLVVETVANRAAKLTIQKPKSGKVGVFKRCSLCGQEWMTRDEFLADKTLKLNGYQGSLRRLKLGEMAKGLLLFTHHSANCGTTLAIEAKRFKDSAEDT